MPAGLTVTEAALMYGKSVQTVRSWIAEGAPVIRKGRRGGPGAILDAARLPGWLWQRQQTDETAGDRLKRTGGPCGGNMLRWLIELHLRSATRAVGCGIRHWYDTAGWEDLGIEITDEQARALSWRLFEVAALYLSVATVDRFDAELEKLTDSDLDAWASLLFKSDFETSWSDVDQVEAPAEIVALAPKGKIKPRRRRKK